MEETRVSGAEEEGSNIGGPEDAEGVEGPETPRGEVRGTDGQESDAEEDCGPKRIVPDPGAPTQSEIDEHNVDHLPYRSWCECCVKGKATGEPPSENSSREQDSDNSLRLHVHLQRQNRNEARPH